MADLSVDDHLRGVIEAWNKFRDDTERLAREIGEALREVVASAAWHEHRRQPPPWVLWRIAYLAIW